MILYFLNGYLYLSLLILLQFKFHNNSLTAFLILISPLFTLKTFMSCRLTLTLLLDFFYFHFRHYLQLNECMQKYQLRSSWSLIYCQNYWKNPWCTNNFNCHHFFIKTKRLLLSIFLQKIHFYFRHFRRHLTPLFFFLNSKFRKQCCISFEFLSHWVK